MTDPARPDDDGPVPAFVTIGVGVPLLIVATILVDMANWSAMLSTLAIASLVAVCCIYGELGVAAFLGVVTWLVVNGFVEDTGGILRGHSVDFGLFAICVALPTFVASAGVVVRWARR